MYGEQLKHSWNSCFMAKVRCLIFARYILQNINSREAYQFCSYVIVNAQINIRETLQICSTFASQDV